MVPATPGYHSIAVDWQPPPDQPEVFRVTAHRFKSVEQLRHDHPELADVVMKHDRPDKFVLVRQFKPTLLDNGRVQVFGVFNVVKNELKRNPEHGVVLKQDFLVWMPGTGEPPVYYSGLGGRGDPLHLHIKAFCERFGESEFGCRKAARGTWTCEDHWYRADVLDVRLPPEVEFRAAVNAALTQAREEIGERGHPPLPHI